MKIWMTVTLLLALLLGAPGSADGDESGSGFRLAMLPSAGLPDTAEAAALKRRIRWLQEHGRAKGVELAVRPGGITRGNQPEEWEAAAAACSTLRAAGISSLLVPGASDMAREGPSRNLDRFRDALRGEAVAIDVARGQAEFARCGHGALSFTAAGVRYLVIGLALDPGKDALCLAGEFIQHHTDHKVILVTPRYLDANAELAEDRETDSGTPTTPGSVIWNELVRRHSNICMVICGQAAGDVVTLRERATGNEADRNALVDPVIEMGLADDVSGDSPRLIHFDVDEGLIRWTGAAENVEVPMDMGRPTSYRYDRCSDLFHDRSVNTNVRRQQRRGVLAGDALGNFVVAWEDDGHRAKGDFEIQVRGFHPDGCERFAEITANATPWGAQTAPAVDMAPDGSFVVAWEDGRRGGDVDIYAAGFDARGRRVFGDVRVNRGVVGIQRRPSVAVFCDGSFVVTWEDDADRNHEWDVHAAAFDGYGRRSLAPFRVHAERGGQQRRPSVGTWSRWSSGTFVVVWEHADGASSEILASGFDARGRPMFKELRVHETEEGRFARPAICVAEDGSFVTAWEAGGPELDTCDVFVSGFDRDGKRTFADRCVSQTEGQHRRPDVALRSRGDFTVVWEHRSPGRESFDVRGAGFDGRGEPRFVERVLPATVRGAQRTPRVDVAEDGSFLTTWVDDSDLNGFYEIRVNRSPPGG